MKKLVLSIILCFGLITFVTGCNKESDVTITMNCNGIITENEMEVGDKLSCTLLGEEYEFTVSKIKSKSVELSVNTYGLTDTSSLIDKSKKFTIKKDKSLSLSTQTTDAQESVVFDIKC